MTIKDVEKITGLTAKSIRYYEQKGLIEVGRKKNDYRDYTEDDVLCLKKIKLLRYLEFGVDEIRTLLDAERDEFIRMLEERAEGFGQEREKYLCKQELCQTLAKEYKKGDKLTENQLVEEYNQTVDFIESEEGEELRKSLGDFLCASLSEVIVETLILSGPILWLFVNIYRQMWSVLMINAVFAVAAAACMTSFWIYYVRYRKHHKKQAREKDRKNSLVLPVMIVMCIVLIAAAAGVCYFLDKLAAPKGYLFGEMNQTAQFVLIMLIFSVVLLMTGAIMRRLRLRRAEAVEDWLELWDAFGKWKWLLAAVWLAALYCCATSSTYVTQDRIICYSPIHPTGVTYSYEDISGVETGFGGRIFGIKAYRKKGSFFYILTMEDGHKIVFSQPSSNENIDRYMDDSYLELEEFDQRLMELGIPKESDESNWEACDMDQVYVDRFLRIIRNKK